MSKFVLVYRGGEVPPEEQDESMARLGQWIGGLVASKKQVGGMPLEPSGKVVSDEGVMEYVDADDSVDGYSVLEVANLDEAVEIAKGAPVVDHGGMVEVRPVMEMPDMPM